MKIYILTYEGEVNGSLITSCFNDFSKLMKFVNNHTAGQFNIQVSEMY